MSYRYNNAFVKPGLNTLVAPAPSYTYGLWSWGGNGQGQLGLGNTTSYSSPKQVGSGANWNYIANGFYSSFAVKTDGTLWGWGRNNYGQLGVGNTTYYSSPKQIGALTNWLNVAASYDGFTAAIKTDGTLWSWGVNGLGQLGLGTAGTNYSSPVQVGTLTNWSSISCGYAHAIAVKTDGTLWSWGYNIYGQLGYTTSGQNRSSPVQVGALTNWLKVAAGYNFSIAIKTDGTFWSWGQNSYGNLGLGNTTTYSSPKQVGALTTWSSTSCGKQHVLSTRNDNTLWSWGRNSVGQLGLGDSGNYAHRSSPTQVGLLTTWLNVGCGTYMSMAIKTNGNLCSWGQNTSGQMGVGNTTNYSSPKQVGSLTSWGKIAAGFAVQSTIALQY